MKNSELLSREAAKKRRTDSKLPIVMLRYSEASGRLARMGQILRGPSGWQRPALPSAMFWSRALFAISFLRV